LPDYRAENVAGTMGDWLKRNTGMVAVVGGLVVIIAAVLIYGKVRRERDESEAQKLYSNLPVTPENRMQVLMVLVNNYAGTSIGTRAKLDYADELYERKQFEQAEKMFEDVRQSKGDNSLEGVRAKLGLAYCAVERQDYDRARGLFEEIKTAGSEEGNLYAVYAGAAERRLNARENPPAMPEEVKKAPEPELVAPSEQNPGVSGTE